MYYPCSKNKDADQLRGYREADLRLCFRPCKLLVFSRTGSNKNFIINRIDEHLKTQDNQTWISHETRPEARRGNGRNKLRTYKLFLKNRI